MVKNFNSVDRFVGNRVQSIRQRLGVSLDRAAEALGVTERQLRERERGSVRFEAKELQKLTKLFDVSVCRFFEGFAVRPREDTTHPADNESVIVEAAE